MAASSQARFGGTRGRSTQTRYSRPGRTLFILLLVLLALAGATTWSTTTKSEAGEKTGSWLPKLGLDLEGGTSITLKPVSPNGQPITSEALDRAVEIIRNRVDGYGVSEAEVARNGQGDQQVIVVDLPGERDQNLINLVKESAQLRFRYVLETPLNQSDQLQDPTQVDPNQVPVQPPAGQPSQAPSGQPSAAASVSAKPSAVTSPAAAHSDGLVVQPAVATQRPETTVIQPISAPTGSATASDSVTPSPAKPTSATSPSPTPAQPPATPAPPQTPQQEYQTLECNDPKKMKRGVDDPNQQLAACGAETRGGVAGQKFLLDKAVIVGEDLAEANAVVNTQDGGWMIAIKFTAEGANKFNKFTNDYFNQYFAIVLDSQVISYVFIEGRGQGRDSQITGSFTQAEATQLANSLKYGALPLSFTPDNEENISPTLGSKQLRGGLIAGLLGLILVILYSVLYYRVLGLVNVASLAISAVMTGLTVVMLSNWLGLRLSLAGIAGLVIGIGIAADSFIVFFERLRDELREGKTLRLAVEDSWKRARRTIVAADFVSFLAAIVLYILSVGSVRGFALMLGLSTIVDIVLVFMFTKPMVTLLTRSSFFNKGHPLSGLAVNRFRRQPDADARAKTNRQRGVDVTAGQEA